MEVMGLELQQLVRLKIFNEPMVLPDGAQLLGTCLIFKKKRTADGHIERYKARLVAQGFLQTFGIEFFDTYALVNRLTCFCIIYALCVLL